VYVKPHALSSLGALKAVTIKTATFSEVKPCGPIAVPARLHGVTSKKTLHFNNSIDCPVLGILLPKMPINPLKPELNPICYLLALLAHHFLHVSRIRVKSLTFRRLMSYIYGAPILDVSRSHTTTQHSR